MLAVSTATSLTIIDAPTLKKPPASVSTSTAYKQPPSATVWASDNSCLFIATSTEICKYTSTSQLDASVAPLERAVTAILSKDKGATLIYSCGNEITVLETASGKPVYKIDSHEGEVNSLALSNDASLLASTSITGEVHVHNLASASHIVVRGQSEEPTTASSFHTHSKSKLLLAIGTQLFVYDTSKPSTPVKTVQLDKNGGKVVSIVCSPFSKSLVAVASSAGSISLVDLEKEKGLVRTISTYVQLTCLVFSAEGAALYAGTDDGKVLVLDLRALDKPAKAISINSDAEGVICMSVQRKLKPGEGPSKPPTAATAAAIRRRAAAVTGSPVVESKRGIRSSSSAPGLGIDKLKPVATRTRTISSTAVSPSGKSKLSLSTADLPKSTPPTPSGSRTRTTSTMSTRPPIPPVPVRTRTISSASAASSPSSRVTTSSRASRGLSSGTSVTSVSSPVVRKVSGSGIPNPTRHTPFSPPKSPLIREGEVVNDEPNLTETLLKAKANLKKLVKEDQLEDEPTTRPLRAPTRPSSSTRIRTISESATSPQSPRVRTTSFPRKVSGPSTRPRLASNNTDKLATSTATATRERTRTRTISANAATPRPSTSTRPSALAARSRSQPRTSPSLAPTLSPIPPVPMLPPEDQLTAINMKFTTTLSRTPSPDFASLQKDAPKINVNGKLADIGGGGGGLGKKAKEKEREWKVKERKRSRSYGLDVLGLGTPEVRRWVQATQNGVDVDDEDAQCNGDVGENGVGEVDVLDEDGNKVGTRKVGFVQEPENEVIIERIEVVGVEKAKGKRKNGIDGEDEGTIKMTVQISPRKPISSTPANHTTWGPIPSPYNALKEAQQQQRSASADSPLPTTYQPSVNPAHDLLHTLIRDALYDFRRETKAEIIGLHLDLVKMGRGWRKEMREALEKWGDELKEIRQENDKLREENERLRRGY